MLPTIFTDFRREMIARTLFDLFKIILVAAFASKFFLEFPKMVQFGLWCTMAVIGVSGCLCCPLKKPKE